jgi:hypothetical protein
VKSVQGRHDHEALAPPSGDQVRQRQGQPRLPRTGWAGNPEKKALGRRIDGGEQLVREAPYSLLEAAQRLIPVSVA